MQIIHPAAPAANTPVPLPPDAIFQQLADRRIFIVARKSDKHPVNPFTGANSDAQDQTTWTVPSMAALARVISKDFGIGVVLSPATKLACIDVDGAKQSDGTWSTLAQTLLALFAGAYFETSVSGRGLHIIFSYTGEFPAHKCKNTALHIELYHEARYILLTGTDAYGSALKDCTAAVPSLIEMYFSPTVADHAEWTEAPLWSVPGTADDAELIRKMRAVRSPGAIFGSKASTDDLWTGNVDALAKAFPSQSTGKHYDASSADQALANHLIWWTGGDCARTERLMCESALKREKWEARPDYLRVTILDALGFVGKNPPKELVSAGTEGEKSDEQQALEAHKKAVAAAESPALKGVTLADFYSSPTLGIIFVPLRAVWPAESVDSRVPWVGKTKPSRWLARHRSVEAAIWSPGDPMIIQDRLMDGDDWVVRPGCSSFNLYRAPTHPSGDPALAEPWVQLLRYVYPSDADHFLKWFAHRRQFPGVKPNHGLVLGGAFGIGKDSLLEPLVAAVGSSNFREATPATLIGRFNPFVKGVILRVSEAHDQGDLTRYQFYDRTKIYLASPPKTLTCDEKNMREHQVMNVMGLIYTTNHTDGLFLPPNDRRHYVAWSELTQESFQPGYWRQYYAWLEGGGTAHVIALLDSIDLSTWDIKADPPKTPAFWVMVDSGRSPEDSELSDALDKLGNPAAVTLDQVRVTASPMLQATLGDPKKRRQLPHLFDAAGYQPVRNAADVRDGQWKISGKRQTVYAQKLCPNATVKRRPVCSVRR